MEEASIIRNKSKFGAGKDNLVALARAAAQLFLDLGSGLVSGAYNSAVFLTKQW